jgi:hypothetical protein
MTSLWKHHTLSVLASSSFCRSLHFPALLRPTAEVSADQLPIREGP